MVMLRPSSLGISLDLRVVLDVVVEALEDVTTELRVGDLTAAEAHGALHLVPCSQELDDSLLLDLVVAGPDLRSELDFLDHRACLVLAGFARLDGLVVLVLAVVHHADDRWPGVGCDLDEVHAQLAGEPSSFLDVLLTDLCPVRCDQTDALDSDSFVDPWLRDGSTSCCCGLPPRKSPTRTTAARCTTRKFVPAAPRNGGQVGSRRLLLLYSGRGYQGMRGFVPRHANPRNPEPGRPDWTLTAVGWSAGKAESFVSGHLRGGCMSAMLTPTASASTVR